MLKRDGNSFPSVCMCVKLVFWRAKSTVLIKYSGKYIEIYFNLKITCFKNFDLGQTFQCHSQKSRLFRN